MAMSEKEKDKKSKRKLESFATADVSSDSVASDASKMSDWESEQLELNLINLDNYINEALSISSLSRPIKKA